MRVLVDRRKGSILWAMDTETLAAIRSSYETLLAMLRLPLNPDQKERVQAELRSRDRAMHNQWVETCGGQFK